MADSNTLGAKLHDVRIQNGLGLREAAAKAGMTHGYLSQIEADKVKEPAPQILHKLAEAYDQPFTLIMQWAGYLEDDPAGLSPNQARALKIVGEPTDNELKAIRAVLDAIRAGGATFPALEQLDGHLDLSDITEIRQHATALLRRAEVLGTVPTPLPEVMSVSSLVLAGEIELEPEIQRRLRDRFGDLVDKAMGMILGSVRFDARTVYVKPDMYRLKQRFVQAHEIGHEMLPWHRELFAFLDDKQRVRPDVNDRYERQANQAAIEILAQGDHLRREADDSRITFQLADQLADRYEISLQATIRRIVEESRQDVALAISYRGSVTGKLMPAHLYCSTSFEARFAWRATGRAEARIMATMRTALRHGSCPPLTETDMRSRAVTIETDTVETPQAVLVIFRPVSTRPKLLDALPIRR